MEIVLRSKPFEDTVSGFKNNYECWFYSSFQRLKEFNIIDENFVIILYTINQNLHRNYIHILFLKLVKDLEKLFLDNELSKYSIFIIPVTGDNGNEIIKDIKKKHQNTLST